MLAAVGAIHVVSSVNAPVEFDIQQNLEMQKDLEHAWYQKLEKEKEKQEWSKSLSIRILPQWFIWDFAIFAATHKPFTIEYSQKKLLYIWPVVQKNVKWESSKSNPLEPYVDDQSSTLTTLSNAAFVFGGECKT